ncbi:class I adenylate-forming enzyme family protein [Immundisolibacter sp.]|uniref:class I adenylate-forming enzyme family protein n=1 Tax=Immundisolibacter sp. TaxID=1934948 RepID=UPI003562B729
MTRDTNLREMLHRSAKWYPNNEAVVDELYRYTYAELKEQVQRMAKLLHTRGVRKGDRVALLMYPSVAHVVALFGAFELGAIPSALHLRESPKILAAVLERLSPRVMVYDGALSELADQLRQMAPLVSYGIRAVSEITPDDKIGGPDPVIPRDLADYPLDFEPMPIHSDDVSMIALSSGTTGVPKGIMHTHRTQIESARGGGFVFDANPYSCIVNVSTTAFIGWYNCTLPYLNAAGKIVFMAQWDPKRFLQKLQDERATFAFLVPTVWRMLFRENLDNYDLSSLKKAGYAGEPMDTRTMGLVREKICKTVINIYGTTETGSCSGGTIMFNEDYRDPSKQESVGKPFINADVRVIQPGGALTDEVAPGEEGEVIIRGLSVAEQVWEQPAVARKIFEDGWWRSGDMGTLDADNYLYLRGRIDDMIISGGINVLPSQVEEAVLGHAAVSECVVVGIPDEQWGQRIVAFVVAREAVTPEQLKAHVEATDLSSYKRPREYRLVNELPRGNTNKVSRRMVRTLVSQGQWP